VKNFDISEEKMQAYLINKNFLRNLSAFIGKEKVTCKNVLDLSADILNSHRAEPPEGWLVMVALRANIVFMIITHDPQPRNN
jgi:hypothetical protein